MSDPNILLKEVVVTGKRLSPQKYKTVVKKTKLYPKGEVETEKIDSIKASNPALARAIGNPVVKLGEQEMYGSTESDIIKKALKAK